MVTNNFPERQHKFQKKKIIPGEESHGNVVSSKVYNTNNVVVFRDSISCFNLDIRSCFNKEMKNDRAVFKYFPRATSNDLIYDINPTLEEGKFDKAVIHIGINDMLSNSSGGDNLMQNNLEIAAKCKSHHKILHLIFTFHKETFEEYHSQSQFHSIFNICKEYQFYYIDNNNIYSNLL